MRTRARNHRLASSLTAGLLLLCTAAAPAAVTPIVEFKFNDSGTATASTGSAAGVSATILNAAETPTDLRAPGVTGGASDKAFDNSASTGMGGAGTGGRVNVPVQSSLNGAAAITITGWFRVANADATGTGAYIVDIGSNDTAKTGLRITWDGSNRQLRTDISSNGVSFNQNTGVDSFAEKQTWIFFAFTYNSALSSSQVWTYKGTLENPVAVAKRNSLGTVALGALTIGTDLWAIGNVAESNTRPFDGQLDNIRIFNTALTLQQLEDIRKQDIQPQSIPEPAASAMLVVAGSMLASARRR